MNDQPIHALLIVADPRLLDELRLTLTGAREPSIQVDAVPDLAQALERLVRPAYDIVILDSRLLEGKGLPPPLRSDAPGPVPPIVVFLSRPEELELDVIREQGEAGYLCLDPLNGPLLICSVRYAVEHRRLMEKHHQLEEKHHQLEEKHHQLEEEVEARLRAEQTLLESERRFRELVENASDVLSRFRIFPELVCEYISPRITDLLGHTPEEFYADPDLGNRLVHPDDRESRRTGVVKEGVLERSVTLRYLHRDGRVVWIEAYSTPIFDEAGRLVAIESILRDVTRRRAAEEERQRLLEEERSARALLEAVLRQMPAGVVVIDAATGRIKLFNDQLARMWRLNVSEAELAGYMQTELFRPYGKPYRYEEWPIIRSLRYGEQTESEEMHFIRGDGTKGIITAASSPVYDSAQRIVAAVSTVQDITVQRRIEHILRSLVEASRQLADSLDQRATLHAIAQMAVTAFADLCLIDLVRGEQQLERAVLACLDPEREPLARQLVDQLAPDLRLWAARVIETRRSMLLTDFAPSSAAPPAATPGGELVPRAILIVPMIARGRIIGLIIHLATSLDYPLDETDIPFAETFALRAALALENARLYQEAREALQIREEFLSVAAHELKTPITSLLLYVQLANRLAHHETLDPERFRRMLDVLDQQASRMSHLLNRLLDFTRVETGKLVLDRAPTDFSALVGGLVNALKIREEGRRFILRTEAQLIVDIDPVRIEQVVTNLLDNAIKYSPADTPIEVDLTTRAGEVVLSVRDYGAGIPVERRDLVFSRFYQAHGEGHLGGVGLGLYISRQIVEMHGGSIEAEFPREGGTRFIVRLPRTAPQATKPQET